MISQKTKNKYERFLFGKILNSVNSFFIDRSEKNLYRFVLAKIEKVLIEDILEKTGANKSKTARILGISRSTLYAKIRNLKVEIKI